MPIDFRDLLTKQGLDLGTVMVMRHRPIEPEVREVLPWLAADRPEVFNAYQQVQHPDAEKALKKAAVLASFIVQDGERALFVGLYRRGAWRPVTKMQFWATPAAEMKPFGLRGIKGRKTRMWFDLELTDLYRELKGRLVVKWPPGRLWWRWARTNQRPSTKRAC
jgi:hypothetical protein